MLSPNWEQGFANNKEAAKYLTQKSRKNHVKFHANRAKEPAF